VREEIVRGGERDKVRDKVRERDVGEGRRWQEV